MTKLPTPRKVLVLGLIFLSLCLFELFRPAHRVKATGACSLCVASYHYDDTRQGVNSHESTLTPSNVANITAQPPAYVDGQIYAQPLYMSGLTGFGSAGNALFVATENGSLYALDADTMAQLSMKSILPSGNIAVPQYDLPLDSNSQPCANITYQVGITSTPVMDPFPPSPYPSGHPAIFAVVKSLSDPNHPATTTTQTLAAWDPVANTIVGTIDIPTNIPGFIPLAQNQRAGLALTHDAQGDALIYIAWGSHCDSTSAGAFSGWIAVFEYTYATSAFSFVSALNDVPSPGTNGGIWGAGAAPAVDDSVATINNVYLATGNGSFLAGSQYGESVLRLDLDAGHLLVDGSYTPNAWSNLNGGGSVFIPGRGQVTLNNDQDLGGGGVVLGYPNGVNLAPGGDNFVVLAVGKEGVVYVIDPGHMGTGSDVADPAPISTAACTSPVTPNTPSVIQCFAGVTLPPPVRGIIPDASGNRSTPAFWAGPSGVNGLNLLITAGSQDTVVNYWQMPVNGTGAFNTTFYATGQLPLDKNGLFPYPGAIPVVSWDGTNSGNALAWIVDSSGFQSALNQKCPAGCPAVLKAYYGSPPVNKRVNQAPIFSDASGNGPIAIKWTVPVVINGHVYVAGQKPLGHNCVNPGDATCPGMVVMYK